MPDGHLGLHHVTQDVSPRRILGARRPDRPFPDGAAHRSASTSTTTKSRAARPSTPIRSAPSTRFRDPGLPAARFSKGLRGRTHLRIRNRDTYEVDPSAVCCTRTSRTASRRPASSNTCRVLRRHRDAVRLPPAPWAVVLHRDVPGGDRRVRRDARSLRLFKGDPARPVMPPEALSSSRKLSSPALKDRRESRTRGGGVASGGACRIRAPLPERLGRTQGDDPQHRLKQFLDSGWADGAGRVLLLRRRARPARNDFRLPREIRAKPAASAEFASFHTPIRRSRSARPSRDGFVLPDAKNRRRHRVELPRPPPAPASARRAQCRDDGSWMRDLSELKPGYPVVHVSHGNGRYLG